MAGERTSLCCCTGDAGQGADMGALASGDGEGSIPSKHQASLGKACHLQRLGTPPCPPKHLMVMIC